MNYKEAFEQIKKEYEIQKETMDSANILTDIMIDDYNGLAVGLIQKNGKAVLTDYADLVNDFELNIEKVEEICKKHNVEFNNYHIEKKYESIDDLKTYLNCLQEIIETM